MIKLISHYLVAISSVTICASLAFAFNSWVRTVLKLAFHLPYTYFTDWMGLRKVKGVQKYSAAGLKRLESAKIQELDDQKFRRRIDELKTMNEVDS
jgi:hypothetical protein